MSGKTIDKKITAQSLIEQFGGDVYNAIKHIEEQKKKPTIEYPSKPYLKKAHTSNEAAEYVSDLNQYEKDITEYKKQEAVTGEYNRELYIALEEFMKQEAGLYKHVPSDKQTKVWSKAWQDGHSSGYGEVYIHLVDLVKLFS